MKAAGFLLGMLVAIELACAKPGAPAAGRKSPFPNPKKLEKLAAERDLSTSFLETRYPDVETWRLTGPFPLRIGDEPIADPSPWETPLLEAAQRRAGLLVASEAMRCASREFGLFFLAHGQLPGAEIRRYVLGRCGATGVRVQFGYFNSRVPEDASEETLVTGWRERVQLLVSEHLGTGPRAAGLWFGRRGEEALVLLASAVRRVHLEPVSPLPDADGWLRLRGEVLTAVEVVHGQINRGRLGYADCEQDPHVQAPRFSLACPAESSDETAWISIAARPPGRLLSDAVLRVLARPRGSHADTYRRPTYGAHVSVASGEEFSRHLIDEINRMRRRSGLRPVKLVDSESKTAAELAPVYFGSLYGMVDPTLADVAVLGLMAGWEVPGTIRDAGVGGIVALNTHELDRWLAEALEQPGVRSLLLGPERERIAVGPIVSREHGYLAALVASYEFFGDEDPEAQRGGFYEHLKRQYSERGITPPRRDPDLEAAASRHVARVQAQQASPDEALGKLLEEAGALLGTRVSGWYLEGSSPADVPLPEGLFENGLERIAAAVGHYRPQEWPWGRYVVLVVTAKPAAMRTARTLP